MELAPHAPPHTAADAHPAPAPFGSIVMARGCGSGPTPLAAFDAALLDAGVANYNLITLSSVIPPGSVIERRRWRTPAAHWGRRLFCVLSEMREDRPGHEAHAGIGWVQALPGDAAPGAGLFVELHGHDRSRLEQDLHATLRHMQQGRGLRPAPLHTEIVSTRCAGQPVCALAIAIYASTPW